MEDFTPSPLKDEISQDETAIAVHRKSVYSTCQDSALVAFKNLCYFIRQKKQKKATKKDHMHAEDKDLNIPESPAPYIDNNTKVILKNVSGVFRPGRMTAIMGPSGAGKTTLLNAISGRLSGGFVSGDIKVNGNIMTASEIRKISGFVYQDDVLMPTMTPREVIRMSARLRLPESMSSIEKESRVSDILALMNMEKAGDTTIGSVHVHGISGGEKKRTCIAMEMITNPPILFLDEPTSGLDTYTAYRVTSSLSDLAKHGRTVICTIHQPSSEIFYLFDDLILMSEGEVVYHGPVSQCVAYFAALGFPCPIYTNPADYFFMEVLKDSDDSLNDTERHSNQRETLRSSIIDSSITSAAAVQRISAREKLEKLRLKWRNSAENKDLDVLINQQTLDPGDNFISSRKSKAKLPTQLRVLCQRAWNNVTRNKMTLHIRLLQSIVFGLLMGLVFFNVDSKNAKAQIQDRLGVLYFMATNTFMSSMMATLTIFFEEKAVFRREYMAGYYTLFSYYSSKILVELPFYVFYPLLTTAICYYMIGLRREFSHFVICSIINILNSNVAMGFGLLAASAFPHLGVAMGMMPLVFIPLMIFAGLLVNLGDVTPVLSWIQWVSPIKYAFSALAINEFKGLEINGINGDQVLSDWSLDNPFSLVGDILMQLLFYAACIVFAYLALYKTARRSGPKTKEVDSTSAAISSHSTPENI